ncbi:recombinase family protein [Streptomyces sp. NPDC019443]|uniref:recombinase family protein n=1 Tax=Streptomyces sp. NPDC019443 TaxID=3365061 RepID=UPI0037970D57
MPQSVACAVAVLYLRLSHETFVSDSLEGQEADCIRRARELAGPDAKIVIFREVVSASKAKVRRREFDAMAEYIKENRPAFLIAWKWDRVSRQGIRQLADVVELVEDTGVRFVSLKDNLDSANPGWVTLASFLAEQAKEEAKNIQLRVSALRDRHKGRWVKERPFGFILNEDRHLEPHPTGAPARKRSQRLRPGSTGGRTRTVQGATQGRQTPGSGPGATANHSTTDRAPVRSRRSQVCTPG